MKKILILLIASVLLASCFGDKVAENAEDIVSNIVDVTSEVTDQIDQDNQESIDVEALEEVEIEVDVSKPVVSGGDNDPRVQNTQGKGTNTAETLKPSVPTEKTSNPEEQEIIKDFEVELDGLFDLLESDEG